MRNFPSQTTEQEVKDLFRDNVGDVTYIELYSDENGKVRQMWYRVFKLDMREIKRLLGHQKCTLKS